MITDKLPIGHRVVTTSGYPATIIEFRDSSRSRNGSRRFARVRFESGSTDGYWLDMLTAVPDFDTGTSNLLVTPVAATIETQAGTTARAGSYTTNRVSFSGSQDWHTVNTQIERLAQSVNDSRASLLQMEEILSTRWPLGG